VTAGAGGGVSGAGGGVSMAGTVGRWAELVGAAGVGAGAIVCAKPAVAITHASMTGSGQRCSIRFIIIKYILDLIPAFIIY
jgi:hypothetical protein